MFNLEIDHTKKYRRKTHNADGNYRNLPDWDKIPYHIGGIIHHLDSKKWLTMYDIMTDIYKYAADWPFDNGLYYMADPLIVQANLKFLAEAFDMVEIQ